MMTNATWARDLCIFPGCLNGKTREKRQRHNMIPIASVLAVATAFIGLWTLISILIRLGNSQRRRGLYVGGGVA